MSDRPDGDHPIGPEISPLVNSGPAPENEIDPAPQIGVGGTSQTDFSNRLGTAIAAFVRDAGGFYPGDVPNASENKTSDTLNRSYFYNVPYPVLLRDCFAGQALPEALRDYGEAFLRGDVDGKGFRKKISARVYKVADAMMVERERKRWAW